MSEGGGQPTKLSIAIFFTSLAGFTGLCVFLANYSDHHKPQSNLIAGCASVIEKRMSQVGAYSPPGVSSTPIITFQVEGFFCDYVSDAVLWSSIRPGDRYQVVGYTNSSKCYLTQLRERC